MARKLGDVAKFRKAITLVDRRHSGNNIPVFNDLSVDGQRRRLKAMYREIDPSPSTRRKWLTACQKVFGKRRVIEAGFTEARNTMEMTRIDLPYVRLKVTVA